MAERLRRAFARGAGHGLLRLGEVARFCRVFAYCRGLGSRCATALCPGPKGRRVEIPLPSAEELAVLASAAAIMPRAEYLSG